VLFNSSWQKGGKEKGSPVQSDLADDYDEDFNDEKPAKASYQTTTGMNAQEGPDKASLQFNLPHLQAIPICSFN